ncbi:MAG: hypothetical protein HY549_12515 [Elusimicrobia bacterium]|nr:hypothetical protein [Elusimicrobiota bacterium]
MKWLLWISKPASLAKIAALLIGIELLSWFAPAAFLQYQRWRYPPLSAPEAGGEEILGKLEADRSRKLIGHYQRASRLLDEAESRGLKVPPLRSKAEAALRLNSARFRRRAHRMLSEIEMAIPPRTGAVIPVASGASAPDEEEKPLPNAKPSAGKRRR